MMVDLSVIAPVHDAEIGMGSSQPASISCAYMLSPTASSYFSPLSVLSPTGTEKSLSKDSAQSRGGSLAVRAMRSVRSMARIGGWGRDPSASAQPSSKTNKVQHSTVRPISEEHRVGKEGRTALAPDHQKQKKAKHAVGTVGII